MINNSWPTSAPMLLHNPAAAVQYVCRLLRSYGVNSCLTPEVVRQAKFDAPVTCQPLLLALHDLALLVLSGFPPNSREALQCLKQQLQQEAVLDSDATELPEQGRLLLLHCLSTWGCPQGLVAQLTLPKPSSRAALLALCWLIAHTQLFDRALQHLQLPQHLLPLLPPYPEDTSSTAEAQAHHQAAVRAAQQHQQDIQQLLTQQQSQAGAACTTGGDRKAQPQHTSSSQGCWLAVQTAAHHVLSTYRAATLRLQQLTSLAEAREKLLHQIQQAQLQQPGASVSSSGSGSGTKRPAVLTAFELHLVAHPDVLVQHQQALEQAVSLVQQQQACRQHAQVFFAWATSVAAEVQQQDEQHHVDAAAHPAAVDEGITGSPSASVATAPAAVQKQQQQQQQQSNLVLPHPNLQEVLVLVQQLPQYDSQLAADVLSKLQQQLQQAAAAAGVECDDQACTASMHAGLDVAGGSCSGPHTAAEQLSTAMQQCGLISPPPPPAATTEQQQQCCNTSPTAAFMQTAAAALVHAGIQPAARIHQLQELPDDVQGTLQQKERQQEAQERQQQAASASMQQLLQSSSCHRHWTQTPHQQVVKQQQQPVNAPGSAAMQAAGAASAVQRSSTACLPQQQQSWQQQQHQSCQRSAPRPEGSTLSVNCNQGEVAAAADEVVRLSTFALQVAKLLAKVRASNKQGLAAAAQALLAADDGPPGQQLVLYQG